MHRVVVWSCLVGLAAGLVSAGSSAQGAVDDLPQTPAARRFAELLEVFNTGNREAMVGYAVEHFTPGMLQPNVDSIVDFLMQQYAATGGYDVRRVLQSSAGQISVLVQSRQPDDRWRRWIVGAETDPPHRVQGLFTYGASAALAQQSVGPVREDDLPRSLEAMIDALAQAGDFSGSVCLSQDGKLLVHRAWGEADRTDHVRNTVTTKFGIASLGKMFTAVAIAQLVEQGALRYEDPVIRIIPAWMPPGSETITVHHLLTHTSGLGDYLQAAMQDTTANYESLTDYRRFATSTPLAFTPGSQFRYSNTGYLLLGIVVERVSGMPWDRYLQEHVFDVAGMPATQAFRPATASPDLATGYFENEQGNWQANDALVVGRGTPAGGSASTAADLNAFARGLLDGRLISDATLQRMTTAQADMEGTGRSYGYGFTMPRGAATGGTFGHSGGFPGVSALLEVDRRRGFVLAVLSNQDQGADEVANVWRDLLARLVADSQ